MIAKETKDMREIKSIIFHPSIHSKIEDDENKVVDLPVKDAKYIGCYVDDNIVGVGMYHKVEDVTVCHMHILKEHRKTIGLDFGKEALKQSPDNILYTNIDETLGNIMKYVELLGFKPFDIVKDCIKKGGKSLAVHVYKIDLSEVL